MTYLFRFPPEKGFVFIEILNYQLRARILLNFLDALWYPKKLNVSDIYLNSPTQEHETGTFNEYQIHCCRNVLLGLLANEILKDIKTW